MEEEKREKNIAADARDGWWSRVTGQKEARDQPEWVGEGQGGALSLPDSPSYQPHCQEIHIPARQPIGPD